MHQGLNFSDFSLFKFSPLLCDSSSICFKGAKEKNVPVNSSLAARPTALLTPHRVPVWSDLCVVLFVVEYLGINYAIGISVDAYVMGHI